MDKKSYKALKEEYKLQKTYMGVFKITNIKNGKIYIHAEPNMKNRWLVQKGHLDMGIHQSDELQKEYKEFGPDAFEYEVLFEKDTEGVENVRWAVKELEKEWISVLAPYGEKGYHKKKD